MESNQVLKGVINGLSPKSGSGYADTDLIQLYANDGTPNGKIARSALMSCVKDSLGSLLNAGADQTTVAKVPTLNGNTLGASTVATLASVLGGLKREPTAKSTFQALPFGIVSIYDVSAYSDKPSGYSYSSALYIKQKLNTTNDVPIEVLIGTEDAAQIICTRYNYASDWNTLTVPSFYKDYSTLGALATALQNNISFHSMQWHTTSEAYQTYFKNWADNASAGVYIGLLSAGWIAFVFGYKWSNEDGSFFFFRGAGNDGVERFGYFDTNGFVVTG